MESPEPAPLLGLPVYTANACKTQLPLWASLQILLFHNPKQLLMLDIYENSLYDIELELKAKYPEFNYMIIDDYDVSD